MNFESLENNIQEWFLVKDTGIIRLICATVVAHQFSGDPVWLFIISPPSGLKSELIRALNKVSGIYPLSSLTPHTLISGQRKTGTETSLLFKVANGIFTFKDFTTVLELYEAARQEILSQLREVYDGQYAKAFGTGEEVKWQGKIGFIAGVTEAVDLYQGMYNILGERFLQYRMLQPDRREATRKGLLNADGMVVIRDQMLDMFGEYLNGVSATENLPDISTDWQEEIIEISDFATRGRSGVKRDSKDREISNVFTHEMPIRFAKQLILLAKAFAVMGMRESDKLILRKIALDSLPKNRIKVLAVLVNNPNQDLEALIDDGTQNNNQWETTSVATSLNLPTTTVRRILQDLDALGFLDRSKQGTGKSDHWCLKDEYSNFFAKYYPSMDEYV